MGKLMDEGRWMDLWTDGWMVGWIVQIPGWMETNRNMD